MEPVTAKLQTNIMSIMGNYSSMYLEAKAIYDAYWATNANTIVAALALSTTGATVESKLTKGEFSDMITTCDNLYKMFTNSSVATTDHKTYVYKALYGTSTISVSLGNNVEELGTRLQALAWQIYNVYGACKTNIALYFDNEVGDIVSALDANRIIPGSSVTQADFASAITLMQDYVDFMENAAVTQSDYKAVVSKWLLY